MRVAALQAGLDGLDDAVLAEAFRRCASESVDLLVLPECYIGGMIGTHESPVIWRDSAHGLLQIANARTCR
jgi:hypothetical protein